MLNQIDRGSTTSPSAGCRSLACNSVQINSTSAVPTCDWEPALETSSPKSTSNHSSEKTCVGGCFRTTSAMSGWVDLSELGVDSALSFPDKRDADSGDCISEESILIDVNSTPRHDLDWLQDAPPAPMRPKSITPSVQTISPTIWFGKAAHCRFPGTLPPLGFPNWIH
jgi:hypothetical protein